MKENHDESRSTRLLKRDWESPLFRRRFRQLFLSGTTALLLVILALGGLSVDSRIAFHRKETNRIIAVLEAAATASTANREKFLSELAGKEEFRDWYFELVVSPSREEAKETARGRSSNNLGEEGNIRKTVSRGPYPPEVQQALAGRIGRARRWDPALKQDALFFAIPFGRMREQEVIFHSWRPAFPWNDIRGDLKRCGLVFLLAEFLLALVSFRTARRMIRPLRALTKLAEEMAEGRAERRWVVLDEDELGRLGNSLNELTDRFEENWKKERDGRERLETIFREMNEGVVAVDEQERILFGNAAARRLLDLVEPFHGKKYWEEIRNPRFCNAFRTALQEGRTVRGEGQVELPSGESYVRYSANPIRSEEGRVMGAVMVIEDVTERRRNEEMRRKFVANASHELRTPVTAIRGALETLQEFVGEDGKPFLEMAHRHGSRLEEIVEDVLTLSRLDADATAGEREGFDLRELSEVGKEFEAASSSEGPRLEIETSGAPVPVTAARRLLERALRNLLENAVRHAAGGEWIRVRIRERDGEAEIEVEDDGPGIPEEERERIFERFYRIERSRTREEGGSGLGLSIVKDIVLRHRGTISVHRGSTGGALFRIRIPMEISSDL
ncbi:MAG: sensor histidine kinase [Candidatus Hydrogenedentota bacterium]|nr:MAG: sensor histidine kinase [Candidatus Hydrogenedentota bacterium]